MFVLTKRLSKHQTLLQTAKLLKCLPTFWFILNLGHPLIFPLPLKRLVPLHAQQQIIVSVFVQPPPRIFTILSAMVLHVHHAFRNARLPVAHQSGLFQFAETPEQVLGVAAW